MKITHRGWPGHYCLGHHCIFHLNTLVEHGDVRVVVSTVGNLVVNGKAQQIGLDRYYETMAFHAEQSDKYWDADPSREIMLHCDWTLPHVEDDDKANDMHDRAVGEIALRILKGEEL